MYALWGSILGASFILIAFVAITKEPTLWVPAVVTGGILVVVLTWLATTTLILSVDAMHYRSVLVRADVPLAEIISAKLVIGFSGYKPYQRLVVTTRKNSGNKEIIINTGLFDRAQVKQWVDALNARRSSSR
jgi:hypothetical protein